MDKRIKWTNLSRPKIAELMAAEGVSVSVTVVVSNGPVEGMNNRLKMLKRQMFSRAGLDLLAKRFILH